MPLPNLIIIGPPKCGTTSVFDWLSKHPDTCASKMKETNYFLDYVEKNNKNANFIEHGLSRYEKQFLEYSGQSVVFESSPGYLHSDIAVNEFSNFDSIPYLLFIFRDPVDRLYSEYRFSKFKTRSFNGTFDEYCGKDLTGKSISDGRIVTRINHWIDKYGMDRIIVSHFDELKNNPEVYMKSLCRKLGLTPNFYDEFEFDAKNKTVIRRSNTLHGFANRFYRLFPDWARNIIVPIYRQLNQTALPPPTEEDLKLMDRLRDYYQDETWENIQR